MSGEQKSKRRSSFTANRVSLLSRDVSSSKDLYKMVEDDLSKEDRLTKLCRLSLQYTLDLLEKEFKDTEWFKKFKSKAEEEGNGIISTLQDKDMFTHACSKKHQIPNPTNEELDANISLIEYKINKLDEECNKWDTYLEDLKTETTAAEKKKDNLEMRTSDIPDSVKTLASSQYMKPSPDYAQLLTTTQQNMNKAALQMESYSNTVHLLDRAAKVGDNVQQTLTDQLHKESFRGLLQDSTEQISNFISLPL